MGKHQPYYYYYFFLKILFMMGEGAVACPGALPGSTVGEGEREVR